MGAGLALRNLAPHQSHQNLAQNILTLVKRDLRLGHATMLSQAPDIELLGATGVLVPCLNLAALVAPGARRGVKETVQNPTGAQFFGLRPQLWLSENFSPECRTKKTLPIVFQRIPPLIGKLPETGYTPSCQNLSPGDMVVQPEIKPIHRRSTDPWLGPSAFPYQ